VDLTQALVASNAAQGETINVSVRDGDRTVSSGRYLGPTIPSGPLSIALAGEDLPTGGTAIVTVSASGSQNGLAVATDQGSVACAAVGPSADGLKLVYADAGSIIYQRLTVLPRIRWASQSVVIPSSAQRVATLAKGVPSDEVELNTPGPTASGQRAKVAVQDDSDDEIAARVTASGGGYLVVGDAMQQKGWSVTVDGKAAKLVPADDAMAGVFVPAGTHRVEFRYDAPGEKTGAALSGLAVVVSVTLLWWDRRRDRRQPEHFKGRFVATDV
jgi:hypothetical protein